MAFKLLNKKKKKQPVPTTHNVILYGLQRSGTNYLRSLIEQNYPMIGFLNTEDRKDPFHKHFRLYKEKQYAPEPKFHNELIVKSLKTLEENSTEQKIPELYLVVSKDPYSWMVSYLRWASRQKWPKPNYKYILEWNLFHEKWLKLSEKDNRVVLIRYIDIVKSPEKILKKIAKKLDIEPVKNIEIPVRVDRSKKFNKARKKYYLKRNFLEKLSDKEWATINENLDVKTSFKLGYEKSKVKE